MSGVTQAEAILRRLGITEPHEIDLEAVAWDLGAKVKYRPLDGCEARIIGNNDRAVITVNSRSSPRRQRFSIGHEIGHWHHHRGRHLACQSDDIGRAAVGILNPERIADRFASNLLMPDYLLQPVARTYPKESFETVRAISEIFDTGITATAIRLVESKVFSAVLVCHGMNGRKWFTRSPEVPDRWFPREDLCPDSFAFDVLFQDKSDDKFPRKIGADAWFDRWDADRYEVHEQTARTVDGEILTLVLISDGDMLEHAPETRRYRR